MDFPSLLGSAVASETGVQKYNKFYYLQVFSKLFFKKKIKNYYNTLHINQKITNEDLAIPARSFTSFSFAESKTNQGK